MHITETSETQPELLIFAPFGRQNHQRFAYISARERLAEARDLLAAGSAVAAAHGLEAAMEEIEDAGRKELAILDALDELPPVWCIDAELYKRRTIVLESIAQKSGWRFRWVGGHFMAADDESGSTLDVGPTDTWRCSSGVPDMLVGGTGLTSLLAHLRGESLEIAAATFSKIIKKGGEE